jgi:hypothetical protein
VLDEPLLLVLLLPLLVLDEPLLVLLVLPELLPLVLPELVPLLEPLVPPELPPELLLVLPPIARSAPFGLPQPVGPSHPGPALHWLDVEQLPLLPLVTSKKSIVLPQIHDGSVLTCRIVNAAATVGDDALVPPTWPQPPCPLESEQYTATPVCGSASDETSASTRIEHPLSVCQLGFATRLLQPLPAPLQACSAHPRDEDDFASEVPPTATTPEYVAGDETP